MSPAQSELPGSMIQGWVLSMAPLFDPLYCAEPGMIPVRVTDGRPWQPS